MNNWDIYNIGRVNKLCGINSLLNIWKVPHSLVSETKIAAIFSNFHLIFIIAYSTVATTQYLGYYPRSPPSQGISGAGAYIFSGLAMPPVPPNNFKK